MAKRGEKLKPGLNEHAFTSQNQPSPEAKHLGRERKKQAQAMMDMVLLHQSMTVEEFEAYLEQKRIDGTLTIGEEIISRYSQGAMKSTKILLDFIDRHISKAPQETELNVKGTLSLTDLFNQSTPKEG